MEGYRVYLFIYLFIYLFTYLFIYLPKLHKFSQLHTSQLFKKE